VTEHQYEDLLREILCDGVLRPNRTGVDTYGVFGRQLRYDLSQGFPLITTKKVAFKAVVHELIWLLSGLTDIRYLNDNGVHIWDEWASPDGELGPVYGFQWRHWGQDDTDWEGIDQIAVLIEGLRTNPESRRHLVTAWNPTDLPEMALAPCHYAFQCNVRNGKLDLMINQRSCDMFLGVPFNIASYALLTHMLAQQTDLEVGDLIWSGGDCHIYINHFDQVTEQLAREPYPFPTLQLTKRNSIFDYRFEDVAVLDYQHHEAIRAPIAV